MAGRINKSGGKYGGRHTSFIPLAGKLALEMEKNDNVTKISPGIIKTGLSNVSGDKRIKLLEQKSCVLVRVRENISIQEFRVYGIAMNEVIDITRKFKHKKRIELVL